MGKMVRIPAGNTTNEHYNFVVAKPLVFNNCNLRFEIFIIKTIRRFKKWERGGSRYGGATGRVPFQPSPLKFSQ